MGGHPHHRPVPIAHEHIVAHPNGHPLATQGVGDEESRVHALFVFEGQFRFGGAALLARLDEGRQLGLGLGRVGGQGMLRRHRTKTHPHDGVGAGGKDMHETLANQISALIPHLMGKGKAHTHTFTDPVFLHEFDALGPSGHALVAHKGQQLLGILRDVQIVTRNFPLLHHGPGSPALAIDHLLIGQHGHVHRVPVHHLGLAIGQAFVEHFQKEPLVPAVITGVTSCDFSAPVDGQTHAEHLLFHVSNVVVGPRRWRHLVLECSVLSRQPKGIPTHGHQDVVAFHAQVTAEHVVDGVISHMPHVQLATGIRQHGAGVVLLSARVLGDFERL